MFFFIIHHKTFAFIKLTFAQTDYNIYEFIILLNNVTYFIHSSLGVPSPLL